MPATQMETARQIINVMNELKQKEKAGEKYDVRKLSKALATVDLAFDPGTHWIFGLSHDVLGAFIEVISGKTFSRFLKDEIFVPLGMEDTFFRIPEEKKSLLCNMYVRSEDGTMVKNIDTDTYYQPDAIFESGGVGLLSTLGDFGRFANMLACGGELDGVRILGRKTVKLMATNHLGPQQLADFDWPFLAGYGYGLGVRVMIDPPASGCNGSIGEFGWLSGAGTWVMIDPAEELSVVYMQQMSPNLQNYHLPRIQSVIYGGL